MKKCTFALVIVFLLHSCISEVVDTVDKASKLDAIRWNPNIAVPLVYSRLELNDLLDNANTDQFLRIDSDGGMTLVYTDDYSSQTAEELLQLNNQRFSETFTLTASQVATLNANGMLTITHNRILGYDFGGDEIDKLLLKDGSFDMELTTTLPHSVRLSIRILESTLQGNEFEPTVLADNTASSVNTGNSSTDLDALEIDFTQTTQGHSEMAVVVTIEISKQNADPIAPGETITYQADMSGQKFEYVEGVFPSVNFSVSGDTLRIPFFANNDDGTFTLADPRLKFVLANSTGATVQADILRFDGINTSNNVVALTGYPSPLPLPELDFSEVGLLKKDSFTLNRTTSNLADYINNRPAQNIYEVQLQSTNAGRRHWLLDTSRVGVEVDVEIPLEGTATDFSLSTSQPFSLDLENASDIQEVLIRLYTENGFPIDVGVQLYFEDSTTNTVLDSLLADDLLILPSASVDGAGRVSAVNPKTTDINLSSQRIEELQKANRIRIKATLNTLIENGLQPDVKFYSNYDLLVQLGIQAEALLEQQL